MDLLFVLSLLMFCIMVAPLPTAMPLNFHQQDTASYEHMDSRGFPWIPLEGHYHLLVEEHEFNLSSTDAHDKRDLHALLSFKNAIKWDPYSILRNFFLLDLSNNNFNGRIPYDLERLQGFSAVTKPYSIEYPFNMEEYIKGIEYNVSGVLTTNIILDLSKNNLTGEIPISIGNMRSLRLLNFSGNQLEGKIPASFSEISTLEQLDLSKNNLIGAIPQELSQLSMLAYLDVSSNNLCGKILTGTQFYTFNDSSFQKNKCLCGYPLPQCNQSYREAPIGDNGSQSNIKREWLSYVDEKISLITLAMGIGIGIGGVLPMFIVWEKARYWVLGLPPTSTRRPSYGLYRFPT